MEIDSNTGFPELPEGYFWRVKPDSAGTRVHLMRKRKFLPAASTESRYVYPGYSEGLEQAIRKAAGEVLGDLSDIETLRPFEGDYPPKKLGG